MYLIDLDLLSYLLICVVPLFQVAPEIPEGMILIIKIGYLVSMICLLLYMLIVGFSG